MALGGVLVPKIPVISWVKKITLKFHEISMEIEKVLLR